MSILIAPTLFSDDLPFILPQGEGYNWHFDESQQVFIVHLPQGELRYAAHFFDKKTSDDMLDYLLNCDYFFSSNELIISFLVEYFAAKGLRYRSPIASTYV
jgi:hypothetical protein